MATSKRAYAWKWVSLSFGCALIVALLAVSALGLPIGSCAPSQCPEGYMDGGVSCAKGLCTRTCVTGECGTASSIVYDAHTNLDEKSQSNVNSVGMTIQLGDFTPAKTDKCYVFKQTTPSGFIDNSRISGYEDDRDFNSGIALFWETDSSKWYDNQNFYCSGESSQFTVTSRGAVLIDNDVDKGDDFGSADTLSGTNYLYCAPNQRACDVLNDKCDVDCYGRPTGLRLGLYANLDPDYDEHSLHEFCTSGEGHDEGDPEIKRVDFDEDDVRMYVEEYDLVNKENADQQCQYWPQCNPADPCCTPEGYFRSSGNVCRSAHNVQCLTANSAGCGGVAYEDRCTGTSSGCPDNNFEIDFDEACDGLSCVEQSCSGWTLQPQRTCNAGACQQQVPYVCQNNLNCLNSSSCKVSPSSQEDCRDGTVYDPLTHVCYDKTGSLEYDLKYDKNGNLLSGLGLGYTYNSFNQLVSVKDSSTGQIKEEYTYDHNGDRRKKVTYNSDGTTTTVYYASGNFIQTVNSSGVYNETYYYFNGKLVGKKDSDKSMLFFHPDHLGSTRLVTDSSANVVADLSYKPFGELIDDAKERFLYTGKELDTTGNYYLGARYLDPAPLYTFTQPDTILPDIYDPQQFNRYAYVRNNPYRYTDPTGHYISPADFLDYASLAHSLYSYYIDPSPENWGWVEIDAFSALIPVFGGVGAVGKTAKYGSEFVAGKPFFKFMDSFVESVKRLFDDKKGTFYGKAIRRSGAIKPLARDSPIWKKLIQGGRRSRVNKEHMIAPDGKHSLRWDPEGSKGQGHVEVWKIKGSESEFIHALDPITGDIVKLADPKDPRIVRIK